MKTYSMNPRALRALAVAGLVVGLSLATRSGWAQADFMLLNPDQSGVAGSLTPLLFSVDLINGAEPSTIEGLSLIFDAPGAPDTDQTPFLNFIGDPLTPDPLPADFIATNLGFFTVDLRGATTGLYTGTATLSYNTGGETQTTERTFSAQVTGAAATPEPGTLGLIYLCIAPLAGVLARRRAL